MNGVLAILERAILDGEQVVVCLPAGGRAERARGVDERTGQDLVVGDRGRDYRTSRRPALVSEVELRQIPPSRNVAGHVDEVPHTRKAAAAEPTVPDIAEGVAVKMAVSVAINCELDARRAILTATPS